MSVNTEPQSIPTSVEGLMAAAAQEAGLDDFGDQHFLTGLHKFMDAAPVEAKLNAVGEQMVYGGIIKLLVNRLRYVEDVKNHPEILDEKITKPIIILGLPRTGTTKLQRVLSAGPEVQRMDYWRITNPAPFPNEEPGNPVERIEAAKEVENLLATQFPGWMARHPTEALEPDEELHLMHGSFECMISWLFARTPSYYDYISQCDQLPMYQHLYAQMQYLQWQDGGARNRPWIMKSPVHTRALDSLLAVFPDAVLVHCHREPEKILPSIAALIEEARKIGSDHVDQKVLGDEMLEYWSSSLNRYLDIRKTLPADRILDIQFQEIIDDVVDVIQRIYAYANLPLKDDAITAFKNHEEHRPDRHWGNYTYSAEDYGYTPEIIANHFSTYCKQYINGNTPSKNGVNK